jgi:hypothetical protein
MAAMAAAAPKKGGTAVTDDDTRREQGTARGRKHRQLENQGKRAYYVRANKRRLHKLLVHWGVPYVDALRPEVVEIVLGDLVELMINDPVAIARVDELLAARRK